MGSTFFTDYYESPIGWIEVKANDVQLVSILFKGKLVEGTAHGNLLTDQCIEALKEYFKGERRQFNLPLQMAGTPFQQRVWQTVATIPYGQTTTYQLLSQQLQQPMAIRAVGTANGKNKLLIVIPCHRVIGSDGHLVGYAGELWRKKWLLEHEARQAGQGQLVLNF